MGKRRFKIWDFSIAQLIFSGCFSYVIRFIYCLKMYFYIPLFTLIKGLNQRTQKLSMHLNVIGVTCNEWRWTMPWWHNDMEMFSIILALCEGNLLISIGFPSQMTHDAEHCCCFWCKPKQAVGHIVNLPVIGDEMRFIWCHCNGCGLNAIMTMKNGYT